MKKPNRKKKAPKAKKASTIIRFPVTPAGDRVLVRRTPPEEVTSFGIIIPDTNKEKSEEGVIIAVGAGKKNEEGKIIPVSYHVGQRVRFSYGDEIKINGVDHILVHEENITAIINK